MSKKSFLSCKNNEQALQLFEERFAVSRDTICNIRDSKIPFLSVDFSNRDYWSISPQLAYHNGKPVVLIPDIFNRFYYFDENGKKCKAPTESTPDWEGCYRLCEPLPKGTFTSAKYYFFLFRHISVPTLVSFAFLSAVAISVGLLFPMVTDAIMTFAETGLGSLTPLLWYFLYGVLVIMAGTILNILVSVIQTRIGQRLYYFGYNAIIFRIFCMPVHTLDTSSQSDMVETSAAVYDHITALADIILSSIVSLCFVIAYFIQLSLYLQEKTVWVFVYMLLELLLLGFLIVKTNRSTRKTKQSVLKEKQFLVAALNGIKKIRQTGSEERFNRKWQDFFASFLENSSKTKKYSAIKSAYSSFSVYLLTFFLLLLAYLSGNSVSSFIVINVIGGCLLARIGTLSGQILNIVDAVSSWSVISSFFTKPESVPRELPLLPAFDGSVHIEHLTHVYKETNHTALDDLSVHIAPNEYVGIVGNSGCGKSTLLNLIIERLPIQKGSITFGEYEIKNYDRTSVLANIGIVMQDDVLVPGTIRDNLLMHCPDADDETLWQALKDSNMYEDVLNMPFQLNTVVADNMSGGQMQRLMLARAIVSKPTMIVLDEATSALDNLSQRIIKETLDRLPCTKIVAAHRLSTIKNCDRILVMDKGNIAEEGTYESLVEKSGIFYELIKRQTIEGVSGDGSH